jgi:hypothetical protein
MNSDIANVLTTTEVLAPASRTANVNGSAVDLRAYDGTLQVIAHSGDITAGDNNSTYVVTLLDSEDTNIENAAAVGTTLTMTNVGAVATAGIETRALNRYLFAQANITGGNSPAFPCSVLVTGETKYSS